MLARTNSLAHIHAPRLRYFSPSIDLTWCRPQQEDDLLQSPPTEQACMFTILCNIPIHRELCPHTLHIIHIIHTLTHAVAKNGANFHRARRSHARGGSGASPSARLVLLDLLFDENLRVTPGDIGPRSHRITAAYHGTDTREERRVCFISNSPRLDLSIISSTTAPPHTARAHTLDRGGGTARCRAADS